MPVEHAVAERRHGNTPESHLSRFLITADGIEIVLPMRREALRG